MDDLDDCLMGSLVSEVAVENLSPPLQVSTLHLLFSTDILSRFISSRVSLDSDNSPLSPPMPLDPDARSLTLLTGNA